MGCKHTIGEICTRICSGGTPSKTRLDYYEGGDIPWLNTGEINFNQIRSTEICITKDGLNNSSAKWIHPNSVIVAMYGATAGKAAISKIALTTNQACCNLEVNEALADYLYVYYWFQNEYQHIASLASGGAQQNLSVRTIKSLVIELPSIKDQHAVATVLSAIDNLIELNTRANDYLLELATALFEHALEKSRTEVSLGDIVDLEDSKRIPLNSRDRAQRKGPYPYYGATAIMDYVDDYLFDGIRILLGEDGTVISDDGKPILQYVWGKYWVNNHAHILKASSIYSLEAIYIALSRTAINHIVTGAVQMKISQRNLKSLQFAMPSPDAISDLNDLFEMYRQNVEENSALDALRDSLLPKLMSGQIDVSQVELPMQPNNHLRVG